MNKKSLGMIETWGYVAAIEALDAGVKAASVACSGYTITPSARVSIHFTGDVAAVTAAVKAGVTAAGKVGQVLACHIIPRPDDQLGGIIGQIPGADPSRPSPGAGLASEPAAAKDKASAWSKATAATPTKGASAEKGRSALIRKTEGKSAPPSSLSTPKPAKQARKRKERPVPANQSPEANKG